MSQTAMRQTTNSQKTISQTILLQRLEGLAFLVAAIVAYTRMGASWWLFALLLFVPDLSMAGYWVNNSVGQTTYNLVHTYVLPMGVALVGFWFGQSLPLAIGLIWLAHIGMDRAVGYGLKEAEGFKFTHLGRL